ncbi:hypothetical protein P3T76_001904 [Phytophthora citrophthora]|uniref:Uncharacterized protein n=1 Tax=Phytophthora citrophthora TaxID=4793 RepID=A0AAD9GYD1_9STRA|nr:hypothetical protein P3T76_001904 [Phytophthora citrophthora]
MLEARFPQLLSHPLKPPSWDGAAEIRKLHVELVVIVLVVARQRKAKEAATKLVKRKEVETVTAELPTKYGRGINSVDGNTP